MCSIFGSYDKNEVKKLATLNSYRGQHSHSLAVVDQEKIVFLKRALGPLNLEEIDELPDGYIIGHQQAPTTDAKDIDSVHPATTARMLLWHNGIIKAHQIKQWQNQYKSAEPWDTKWLLELLAWHGNYEFLSEADGSFACAFYDGEHLNIFRNANSPLFIKGSSISSTRVIDFVPIEAGQVYQLDKENWKKVNSKFETKEQFYWSALS